MRTFRVDLHVHTNASGDGRSSLEAIAKAAKAAGLDAVAITDHNRCTEVPETLEGVLLIPGCEVSTKAGHITALFLDRPLPLEGMVGLPEPEEAVEAIREAGGLAVLAHPYQKPGAKPETYTFPLDGMEAANARAEFRVPDANNRAARLAYERGLALVGGSDAHAASEVGNAYTVLEAEERTVPALREALAAGRSSAVVRRNTPCFRKGLSQWTAARRRGGAKRLLKGVAYILYCIWLDIRSLFRPKHR